MGDWKYLVGGAKEVAPKVEDNVNEDWDNLASLFDSGNRDEAVRAARRNLQNPDGSDWQWLSSSLKDDEKKWFVAAVFHDCPVPKRLFADFLDAAINETSPSFNRQFVEPCVKSAGHRTVNEFLLSIVEGDDNTKIAGAVAALYWANMQIRFNGHVPQYTLQYATPESREAFMALNEVWQRKRDTLSASLREQRRRDRQKTNHSVAESG